MSRQTLGSGRPEPRGSDPVLERERLLDERRFLEASLDDLESELATGELAGEDYERLRARYAARALEVEAALAEKPGEAAGSGTDVPGRGRGEAAPASNVSAGARLRSLAATRRRGIGWAALVCFAAAAAFLALALAGVAPFASSPGQAALPLAARIRTELAEAAALAENHNVIEAVAVYDRVLALDPRQPEALAEGGWLVRLAGISTHRPRLVKGGDNEISEAVRVAPGLAVPRAYSAVALFEDQHRAVAAVAEFDAMLANHPSSTLIASVRAVARRAFAAAGEALPPPFRASTPSG